MAVIGEIATIVSDSQGLRITLCREYRAMAIDKTLTDAEEAILLNLYTKFFEEHMKEQLAALREAWKE